MHPSTDPLFISVRDYYIERSKELSPQKQFHFFSRCYLWSGQESYKKELERVRTEWMEGFPKALKKLSTIHTIGKPSRKTPKKAYRSEGMQKYFHIKTYNQFLFKCLFDRTVFNGSLFEGNATAIDMSELTTLRSALIADGKSLFALSTPAINFLTLTHYLYGSEQCPLSYEQLLRIADTNTLPDCNDDADARIYFYTHAIIGASRFYAEPIHSTILPACVQMLSRAEHIIEETYNTLSLDHKCEFLVCAQLCGIDSALSSRIYDELQKSVSSTGTFFVNTHNTHAARRMSPTFSSMEHTNVLALMAFIPKEAL